MLKIINQDMMIKLLGTGKRIEVVIQLLATIKVFITLNSIRHVGALIERDVFAHFRTAFVFKKNIQRNSRKKAFASLFYGQNFIAFGFLTFVVSVVVMMFAKSG